MGGKKVSVVKKFIGMRIKHLRKNSGMTQAELAERLDISSTHLGFIERGIKGASYELLEKISKSLNVEMRDIFSDYNLLDGRASLKREDENIDEIVLILKDFGAKEIQFVKDFLLNYRDTLSK